MPAESEQTITKPISRRKAIVTTGLTGLAAIVGLPSDPLAQSKKHGKMAATLCDGGTPKHPCYSSTYQADSPADEKRIQPLMVLWLLVSTNARWIGLIQTATKEDVNCAKADPYISAMSDSLNMDYGCVYNLLKYIVWNYAGQLKTAANTFKAFAEGPGGYSGPTPCPLSEKSVYEIARSIP
jgi:hypothetical protein